jgi:NAD(P)-dependent dehydrogenase (short-subunit alcohol dehydrogenase family)
MTVIGELLQGHTALVTGAGRGIGRGIAEALSRHGAAVALNDVDGDRLADVVGSLSNAGAKVMAVPGSVAESASVDAIVSAVEGTLGPVTLLVNNAGINRDGWLIKMTDSQWHDVLQVDLSSQFYTMRRVLPGMIERRDGRIINISSASWLGNVGQANYAAAKAGVVGLTKTASREVAKFGITVNAICPGFIDTDMTRGVPAKVWDVMVSKIPAGRVGTPEDVANVVVFLASAYAAYVTGEVINVGGGMVL